MRRAAGISGRSRATGSSLKIRWVSLDGWHAKWPTLAWPGPSGCTTNDRVVHRRDVDDRLGGRRVALDSYAWAATATAAPIPAVAARR
jgi:hypothetical protein